MKKLFAFLLCTSLLASFSLVEPAQAGRASVASSGSSGLVFREDTRHGGRFQLASQIVPLSQVLEMINAIEPGNQLDTQIVTENGRLSLGKLSADKVRLPALAAPRQRNGDMFL
jgi:hypothetical protein